MDGPFAGHDTKSKRGGSAAALALRLCVAQTRAYSAAMLMLVWSVNNAVETMPMTEQIAIWTAIGQTEW